MDTQSLPVTYFSEPGPQNTEATLEAAEKRAQQLGIATLVVASDSGKTARQVLARKTTGQALAVVTNPTGLMLPVAKLHDYLPHFEVYKKQFLDQGVKKVPVSLSEAVASELTASGATVLRMDWQKFAAYTKSGLRAMDWLGVGVRVGLTIAVWAFLAEAIPADCEVIAIAGTGFGGGGADTAIVVKTATQWRDWRVLETIVRPRVSPPTEG